MCDFPLLLLFIAVHLIWLKLSLNPEQSYICALSLCHPPLIYALRMQIVPNSVLYTSYTKKLTLCPAAGPRQTIVWIEIMTSVKTVRV